jgi:WD40 repeat protein
MSSGPEGADPVHVQAGTQGRYSVDARGGMGVQVGEGNTQIIYTYNRLTWTDGVAPPPLVSVSGAVDSPYRGLGAFEEQDAAFFFGRDTANTELLGRLSRHLQGAGLLVVSGVSGAGKSSLLQAGMLPAIRGGRLAAAPGAASWQCLVFAPGRAPLDELALRVGLLAGADAAVLRRGLDADPDGFALTARQAALAPPPGPGPDPDGPASGRPAPRRLLLVIDQFEQVFTQCAEEEQRRAFITALAAAAGLGHGPDHVPPALVVLGVRADFEARCADYPQLAGPIQDRYLVTAMTGRQLRLAITEPAKTAGSRVDEDLVEVLLADLRTQPGMAGAGVLPLLSHALDQAWRSRTGQALTLADYERTGGIEGAVAASAQRAYDRLSLGQQAAARQVFTRLAATSSDGMDTADRATTAELAHGKSPAEAADVAAVLEAFAAERLLTLAADSVEVSHEVLLTAWPLLRDTWLAETHADRVVRTRLRTVAGEWARDARDPSYLYGGSLLEAASDTAGRIGADPARNPPLSQTERDFLHASDHARRRTARRRQAVIAGLSALLLIAVIAAGIAAYNAADASRQAADATRQAANATRQHAIALSRQLAAEGLAIDPTDPVTARRLAVAAWRVFPTDQAGSLMTMLLAEQQQDGILPADPSGVNGVAFSPDGTLLASADVGGTVRLWNPVTGQPLRTIYADTSAPFPGVAGVAFSRDGTLLASADVDGTVRMWDPVTGRLVRTIQANTVAPPGAPGVAGVAFSSDSNLLASADADGTVRVWDPVTGRALRTIQAYAGDVLPGVAGVAFSRDGNLLASADADGTVRVWNPVTGRLVRTIKATDQSSGVAGVAFSRDGTLLASADSDGTVRVWDPVTGRAVRAIQADTVGDTLGVNGVTFNRDSTLLASADLDGTVRVWDPVTGHLVRAIQANTTGPTTSGVAISPDGTLLASANSDGTVRVWDLVTGQSVRTIQADTAGPTPIVIGVAFSPDGTLVASADLDGRVRAWNPVTRQAVSSIQADTTGNPPRVAGVAFSRDGTLLASADFDGTVRVWDPVTGHLVRAIRANTTGDHIGVNAVAFSLVGTLLASADADGTVRVWDPVTGHLVRAIRANTTSDNIGVNAVAFSLDGKLLASADNDGTVGVWDPVTGHLVRIIQAIDANSAASGVAISPDGKLLASANLDGTVRVWDLVTGQTVRTIQATSSNANVIEPAGIPTPAVGIDQVAFSPDGKLLASVDDDGTVRLWDPVTGQAISTVTGIGVRAVSFSPDGKLLASADSDGAVRFWEVSLFTHPYKALCTDVGPPTRQDWHQYAPGEPQPKVCA